MPARSKVLGNRPIGGEKPLRVPGGLEPLQAPLPLAGGLVGVLRPVVEVAVLAVLNTRQNLHIPPNYVVERVTAHRKPPDVRICRLRNQSRVGTVPPSTSTPHCPACWARPW